MKALILVPALLSTLLAAQDKAVSAVSAVTLVDKLKLESPAIDQLIKTFEAKQALAKAEALIPANTPVFEKSTPQAGLASSQNFSTLMGIYSLAGKAAISAGEWEKGVGFLHKAKDISGENLTNTSAFLAPVIESWSKAVDSATKALTDGAPRRAELQAKAERNASEETELKNFQIYEDNTKKGPLVVKQLQASLDGLKADSLGFDAAIEGVEKSIKAEKEDMDGTRFKGDRVKYVSAVLNPTNLESRATKTDKVNFVNRLLVLDPASKKAQREMDILMGKAAPELMKATRSKGKRKKGN